MFCEKGVLRNFGKFTEKHLCQGLFILLLIKLQASGLKLYLKKALAQVFSCEFCENSQNNFSYITPPLAASVVAMVLLMKMDSSILPMLFNDVMNAMTTIGYDVAVSLVDRHSSMSSSIKSSYVLISSLHLYPPPPVDQHWTIFIPAL